MDADLPASQVVISNANVNCVTRTNDTANNGWSNMFHAACLYDLLRDTVSSSEDPLSANKSATAQILVERVDESDLPAVFSW